MVQASARRKAAKEKMEQGIVKGGFYKNVFNMLKEKLLANDTEIT